MPRYLAQRLAESAIVLLIMSFVIYGLIGLMPGDPIDLMITRGSRPDGRGPGAAARSTASTGRSPSATSTGSRRRFRATWATRGCTPGRCWTCCCRRWPTRSGSWGSASPWRWRSPCRRHRRRACGRSRRLDNAINLVAFAGISIPPFWLAILLIILFAVVLGWLPGRRHGRRGRASAARWPTSPCRWRP